MKKPVLDTMRWSLTSVIAMGLAYLIVGWLLAGSEPEQVTAADVQEATELRLFSNELIALVNEFLERRNGAKGAQVASYERWVDQVFRPRTNDLRQRLIRSKISNRALTDLLGAADRTAAMCGGPRDRQLMERATAAVLEAVEQTESRITQLRATKRIRPGPITPSFTMP